MGPNVWIALGIMGLVCAFCVVFSVWRFRDPQDDE